MFRISHAFLSMIVVVVMSNVLVMYPINDWLTWGALPYPAAFLITELTNRLYGAKIARRVVYAGFFFAVLLSIWFATPKIAFASGLAFLISQLLDISIFNQLRQKSWWIAPLFASLLASLVDSMVFWNLAFWGEDVPLLTWALGDTSIKLLMDVVMLTPFRFFIRRSTQSFLSESV